MNTNRNQKSYSFKSVGRSIQEAEQSPREEVQPPPIGIRTPIQLSDSGLFHMHTDLASQISDNLRNLILTNKGERLGFFDFGADLMPLVFDLSSEQADQQAMANISAAVKKYMPFVSLEGMQVFVDRFDNEEVAKVGIRVSYTIPAIDPRLRILEVMLYVAG
jgi:phage baseplate assembly protein W